MLADDEPGDPDEPGAEAARLAERPEHPEGPEERLVRHVVGIGAGVGGDRADQADGPVVQEAEGGDVPGDRPSDQLVFGRLVAHENDE